jgi:hypothetical protein
MYSRVTLGGKEARQVSDWKTFCRGVEGVSFDGESVEVTQPNERRHRIIISDTKDAYELTGIVARASILSDLSNVPLKGWRRNRATQLVGFKIDQKGRLVGKAWVPKAGLQREEFLFYLRHIATECDLFEYNLTGDDRE